MGLQCCVVVAVTLATLVSAQYSPHRLQQPVQQVQHYPGSDSQTRPKLPPGGFAPPDALEVATRRFLQQYEEAAARSAAAPDIAIYTSDGRPVDQGAQQLQPTHQIVPQHHQQHQPQHQQQHQQQHQPPRHAPAGPLRPVGFTPEVAAARAAFQKQFQAQADLVANYPRAETVHQPQHHFQQPAREQQYHGSATQQEPDQQRGYQGAAPRRPQPPARLLVGPSGVVTGVDHEDDVAAARSAFQSQYDTIATLIASQAKVGPERRVSPGHISTYPTA